jgi:hypothetical protein
VGDQTPVAALLHRRLVHVQRRFGSVENPHFTRRFVFGDGQGHALLTSILAPGPERKRRAVIDRPGV